MILGFAGHDCTAMACHNDGQDNRSPFPSAAASGLLRFYDTLVCDLKIYLLNSQHTLLACRRSFSCLMTYYACRAATRMPRARNAFQEHQCIRRRLAPL